jgi:glycosyltransferase involved in cell wall biosynthesis
MHGMPNSHPYWFFRELGWWRFDRRGKAIRRFVEEQGVGIILAEWLDFAASWFPTLRGLKLPFFAHSHGYDVTRRALERSRNRWRYRRLHDMDGIITVSQVTKTRLVERIKLNPELIHVIPCGVNVPKTPKFRSELEHVTCLHVGRMVEKKAPLTTLKAFHDAQRQILNLRLEMIGDGDLLPACRKYCEEHGLSKIVTLHGVRPPEFVKERLAAADMFLLHSQTGSRGDEEGLPVAILEGMAYALPVVSTRHAGIPEAVLDGETGVLVDEGDENAMGRAIRDLAVQPKLRRQMGERGYRRARDMFSAEREIQMLRKVMFGTADLPTKAANFTEQAKTTTYPK